eukprot:14029861-Alexandrium_andersonii.AAC.1
MRNTPKWDRDCPNLHDYEHREDGSDNLHDDIPLHGRLLKCARSCTYLAHLATSSRCEPGAWPAEM